MEKDLPIQSRVPPAVLRQIKAAADANRRSVSAEIALRLERDLARESAANDRAAAA